MMVDTIEWSGGSSGDRKDGWEFPCRPGAAEVEGRPSSRDSFAKNRGKYQVGGWVRQVFGERET